MIPQVNALARTTRTEEVPEIKIMLGYRHDKDKFKTAGLTPMKSELIRPDRMKACPVQMEAELAGHYDMMSSLPRETKGFTLAIEFKVKKTFIEEKWRLTGHAN